MSQNMMKLGAAMKVNVGSVSLLLPFSLLPLGPSSSIYGSLKCISPSIATIPQLHKSHRSWVVAIDCNQENFVLQTEDLELKLSKPRNYLYENYLRPGALSLPEI